MAEQTAAAPKPPPSWLKPFERPLVVLGELSLFAGQSVAAIARRPYRVGLLMVQLEFMAYGSMFVVGLTGLFTGMVLALQTALSLPSIGVKYYIGSVVSKSLVRELGPVLTALIVGGRIGAGMTAEIGTMKVTEQIDALRSMAADPVKKLVTPKLVATLVMLPALTVIASPRTVPAVTVPPPVVTVMR